MRENKKLFNVFKLCVVALMVFISAFSLLPKKALALASGAKAINEPIIILIQDTFQMNHTLF